MFILNGKKLIWTAIMTCLFVAMVNVGVADLSVHFLDVGQGDAALIVCDGEAM